MNPSDVEASKSNRKMGPLPKTPAQSLMRFLWQSEAYPRLIGPKKRTNKSTPTGRFMQNVGKKNPPRNWHCRSATSNLLTGQSSIRKFLRSSRESDWSCGRN